jgi:hypothetical protein
MCLHRNIFSSKFLTVKKKTKGLWQWYINTEYILIAKVLTKMRWKETLYVPVKWPVTFSTAGNSSDSNTIFCR